MTRQKALVLGRRFRDVRSFRSFRGFRGGFTLIELLVVISIIALLIALLLPALKQARETAYTATCLSQEHQIGLALSMYTNDFGVYPQALWVVSKTGTPTQRYVSFQEALSIPAPYVADYHVFYCPRKVAEFHINRTSHSEGEPNGAGDYLLNPDAINQGYDANDPIMSHVKFVRPRQVPRPSETYLMGENRVDVAAGTIFVAAYALTPTTADQHAHIGDTMNMLYFDMHAVNKKGAEVVASEIFYQQVPWYRANK